MLENEKVIEILLVEDSVTDAELTLEALKEGRLQNNVHHVSDGEKAMAYLRREGDYRDASRPDLILLDLNMPRMDGRDVLKEMRNDENLKVIPVVVLTTSNYDKDILQSYGLAANNYIVKPVDLTQFFHVIQQVSHFWVKIVALPPPRND
ncbi:response regulator [Fuerstiella marisgermanici]|uniref:Response regulator rcp1 n=1 Tax=Fuerstiella marisgermanici TaxID=1891926 RepID=A0A1P8WDW9_9PLAN|nr:response regulator [Fuerstiella marisgermanici]APZ92229.1 Response regulator rcp1 [Fuerstiella marisgermanici]